MGFGCTAPICFNRSANAGFTDSKPDGSTESARIAWTRRSIRCVLLSNLQALQFRAAGLPSSFVYEACGGDREVGGGRVDLAVVEGGGADPGARVGNLRAVFCAAFEPDDPILRWRL